MNQSSVTSRGVLWVPLAILFVAPTACFGLISVVHGNRPVANMGWPSGAERVANLPSRLGYAEGPPFGGGQYRFRFRCENTAQFNEALRVFAAIRARERELVVHDGPRRSSLTATDGRKEPVDWTFTVWVPANWHHLHNDPTRQPPRPNFRKPVPPPRIDAYTGGGAIVWEEVIVPDGVMVSDRRKADRATLRGVKASIHGDVYAMATGQVVRGARVVLVRRNAQKEWEEIRASVTDEDGRFRIDDAPLGRYNTWVRADGFAARDCGPREVKEGGSVEIVCNLSRRARLKGRIVDAAGTGIPDIKVEARETTGMDGWVYPCPDAEPVQTDADGQFDLEALPEGYAQLRCSSDDYRQCDSLRVLHEVPSEHISIRVARTGTVRGRVVGEDSQPRGRVNVIVHPRQGRKRGLWRSTAWMETDGLFEFRKVPEGECVLYPTDAPGEHEPGTSPPRVVKVKAGETVEVELVKRSPETPTGKLRVAVVTAEGDPSPRALVVLESVDGNVGKRLRLSGANPDGVREFKNLAAGDYTVTAYPAGKTVPQFHGWAPNVPRAGGRQIEIGAGQTVELQVTETKR